MFLTLLIVIVSRTDLLLLNILAKSQQKPKKFNMNKYTAKKMARRGIESVKQSSDADSTTVT